MLRTFKTAALAVTCAILMAPVAAYAGDTNGKIPAFDQNTMTINDQNGNCVLTKWDGVAGECGGAANMGRVIFFGFDSAKLTAESKAKLDRLYTQLTDESQRITRANIVGYADSIGTEDYNTKLSQKRANNVHKYLQDLGYTDSNVTDVRALGERSSEGKCPKTLKRKERIACLWEDRRVEIELEYLTNGHRILR